LGQSSPLTRSHATKKRSIVINGHRTSVSLEDEFWDALVMVAQARRLTLIDLVGRIDDDRLTSNLSSSIRLFLFAEARAGRLGPKTAEFRPPRSRRVSAPG